MVKILFYIDTLEGGGAEKVLRNLVNNMDQSRFDITVKTLWPCDYQKYLRPGIRFGSAYPKDNGFFRRLFRLEAALNLTYPLHLKGDYDLECAYLECGATKVIAGSTNRKAKKIAWVHCDLEQGFGTDGSFAAKCALWYAKYDRVACVSQRVKESFVSMFGDSPKAEVVYNTVDSDEILRQARKPLPDGLNKRKKTVLYVGRLSAPKNPIRMLKAHKILLDAGIDHDLWILGEGEEREKVECYISEHGLTDSVKLFGFRDNPYSFMAAADILACASNYEGFSTFATEAMILGKPFVTTDVAGMRELLGDSEFGLVTENQDNAFCAGLQHMLSEPGLIDHFRKQASLRGEDFRTRALVEKTQQYLENLLQD